MKNQHTPGPWYTKDKTIAPHHHGLVCQQATGHSIAVTYDDEGAFNARLIAAAPVMLHALELADAELSKMGCECECENSPTHCAVCAVKQAVAQAS